LFLPDPLVDEVQVFRHRHHVQVVIRETRYLPGVVEVGGKPGERVPHGFRAGGGFQSPDLDEPITYGSYEITGLISMSLDIHAGEIGEGLLKFVSISLEDEEAFSLEPPPAEAPQPIVDPQLEGHVHPEGFSGLFRAQPGQVVDAIAADTDQFADLVDAVFAGVEAFGGDTRNEAEVQDCEEEGPEQREVVLIERTVDEDLVVEVPLQGHRRARLLVVSRRERIVALQVLLENGAVSSVDDQLGLLGPAHFARPLDGGLLDLEVLRCSIRAAFEDVPTPVWVGDDVMGLVGHGSIIQRESLWPREVAPTLPVLAAPPLAAGTNA